MVGWGVPAGISKHDATLVRVHLRSLEWGRGSVLGLIVVATAASILEAYVGAA
jgi:hypothetical protein